MQPPPPPAPTPHTHTHKKARYYPITTGYNFLQEYSKGTILPTIPGHVLLVPCFLVFSLECIGELCIIILRREYNPKWTITTARASLWWPKVKIQELIYRRKPLNYPTSRGLQPRNRGCKKGESPSSCQTPKFLLKISLPDCSFQVGGMPVKHAFISMLPESMLQE